jgi:hypothetical protein
MLFQIYIRFLLTLIVVVTLVKGYKLNCIPERPTIETPSDTNQTVNITQTWTWFGGPVNSSEVDNETVLWDKMMPVRNFNDERVTNWCMHVGAPFDKMNFSKFQVC